MAHVDTSQRIERTALEAFETARDGLCELTVLMPNIASIEPLDRREDEGRILRLDRWRAQADGWLRRIVPDGLASWVVRSAWDPEQLRIDWKLIDVDAPIDIACTGGIVLRELHPGAMVAIEGHLHVLRTPLLVRRQWVEPRLMRMVEHNLVSFFAGVNRDAA